ncbi:MAG: gluconokinase [Cyclobacteriaceae bacterium]
MEPYAIGIDLGTGSAKAIALDHAGKVIDTAQVPYPTFQPKPNYQEQAPELIWQAFLKCISRITTSRQRSPDAVSLSSAMHSVIPVDENGNALMNMIIWADNRSATNARTIYESPAAQLLYEETGAPIHAMTPLCKIPWLKEHEPDLFKRTARFISIKEYVWFKLFREFEVDYSIASATGLMDIEKLIWNENALRTAHLHRGQLSKLVNTNYSRTCSDATACGQMGVKEGTPFFIGASDGCLANVGSFATEEGYMALTIGTSGAVRVARKKPMRNFKTMTFNYRLDEVSYICGGPTNNGGIILKWYAENMLGKKLETANDYLSLLKTLPETNPGAEGLIFLPYILGERAPIWSSDACGVFFGMRAHHRQAHFIRAVIEGISMALYHIAQGMIESGLSITQVHVSGGFVQAEEWLQTLANIFGKKICLINTADASAVGAAFLALKNLGLITDYQQLKPAEIKEFFPQESFAHTYQELFLRYRNLYERVADMMKQENNVSIIK